MANFTQKAIKETFWKMLDEKPLSQITVKSLVEECGINRNSFYYHFKDLPDLIQSIVMEEAERIIEENPQIRSLEEAFNLVIEFSLHNRRAVLHIYNSVNRVIFEQYLQKLCEEVVRIYCEQVFGEYILEERDRIMVQNILKCECFGAVLLWLNDGMKEEDVEDYQRVCEAMKGLPEEFVKRFVKLS
ncbi:TetR/AcrR family transcriptional regulator [Eubacterium oxidoreducens]|uniref:Transcriptional regulator, TetR family n=1 Tax=Eubacterium oxidoreducens TaxID=1732 RepID=A0A1G6CD26_EUBOX|nr:TetR/AcrR family transcriptional regulator [Eubacterium oxidoreducens]SDB30776.1 transcriptional regulator, TetR family [Eubacterium oxidoreducens]